MEKILSITNTNFKLKNDWDTYEGYIIVTDQQEIKVGISNDQCCCEEWGELMSEDDLDQFVGASLIKVYVTDVALKSYDFDTSYEGDAMFVNFETDKGLFQFVAYNIHNGYYGHDAVLITKDEHYTKTL